MGKRSSLETILALGLASSGCVPDESKEYNPGNIDDTVVQQDDTGNPESPTLQVDDLYITMDTDSMELGEVVAVNYSGELNCAYDNVPTGFTGLESCEFTYDSHGINDATNEIKVDVSADGYNPANARIIITVGEGGEENSAPVILTNSLPDATVDEYYEAEISVSDAEGDDISCSLDTTRYAVPTWMNIDDCVLYGTPTDSGMVDVPLTAMDSKGSYVEADLELYVGEENDTVVYTVTVQTPDTKDPIVGAYVSLDCNNGDFITDIADSKGEITGTLTSQTTCEVYANDDLTTPEYVAYLWDHDFTIGNNSITAEIYDNDPSVYDPENVSEDCFGGNIETMRDMLMYGNGMKHKTLGDSGRREFERFSEDELTSPIKYWISDIDDDGEEVSEYVYNNMYDAVTEGLGVMNSNDLGFTYFEEASTIDDAQIVYLWGNQSNVSCGPNSDSVYETYATDYYCVIELHTATSHTVQEETLNTVFTDLDGCGEHTTTGTGDWSSTEQKLWNLINMSEYQDSIDRTYDL